MIDISAEQRAMPPPDTKSRAGRADKLFLPGSSPALLPRFFSGKTRKYGTNVYLAEYYVEVVRAGAVFVVVFVAVVVLSFIHSTAPCSLDPSACATPAD